MTPVREFSEVRKLREKLERDVLEALYSASPADVEGLALRSFGEVEAQPVRYYLYIDVVEELVKAARFRSEAATAVLLGQFGVSEDGPFIEVVAFRDMKYLYGADPVVQTRPAVEEATEAIDEAASGDSPKVVGVFCARPGGGAELDWETARLHLTLFNLPFQVAIVVDGEQDRVGLYARRRRGAFFNAAFYVVEGVRTDSPNGGQAGRGTREPCAGKSMDDENVTTDGDDE